MKTRLKKVAFGLSRKHTVVLAFLQQLVANQSLTSISWLLPVAMCGAQKGSAYVVPISSLDLTVSFFLPWGGVKTTPSEVRDLL